MWTSSDTPGLDAERSGDQARARNSQSVIGCVSGETLPAAGTDEHSDSRGNPPGRPKGVIMNKRDTTGPIDQDVEGHRFSSSDRTIKDHVEPVAWEGDEGDQDTEGRG